MVSRDYIQEMARRIGVRYLKAHLSRILKEVQAGGESVLVTDRGRVVAQLSRPSAKVVDGSVVESLRRMATAGHLRLAEPVVDPYPRSPLSLPEGTGASLLDEERGER